MCEDQADLSEIVMPGCEYEQRMPAAERMSDSGVVRSTRSEGSLEMVDQNLAS
jgi:hypothetical protein